MTPDVRKSVTVEVPIEEAFAVFTERPIEWWPSDHVLVDTREEIVFEPRVDGRYYERSTDGAVIDWGRVIEWDPPRRLAMTWRIDGRWRPIDTDERASEIEVTFTALGPSTTRVELAHVKLWRHGPDATLIHAAIDGPSPGDTLAKYARVVAAKKQAA